MKANGKKSDKWEKNKKMIAVMMKNIAGAAAWTIKKIAKGASKHELTEINQIMSHLIMINDHLHRLNFMNEVY